MGEAAWKGGLAGGIGSAAGSFGWTGNTIEQGAIAGAVGGAAGAAINGKNIGKAMLSGAAAGFVSSQIIDGINAWRNGQLELYSVVKGEIRERVNSLLGGKAYLNGIGNNAGAATRGGNDLIGPIYTLIHNPTNGLIADLVEATLGIVTGTSSVSRQLAQLLQGVSGSITITAHSQGALILSNALEQSGRLSGSVNIIAVGAAVSEARLTAASLQAGATVDYKVAPCDPVPLLVGHEANVFGLEGAVVVGLPSLITPFSSHSNY